MPIATDKTALAINTEAGRLSSFPDEWPHPNLRETLAKAGFYWTGRSDCVKCFVCHIKLQDWTNEDNPWEKHTSNCKFGQLGKEEADLTVEEWLDVFCHQAINLFDRKMANMLNA